MGRLPARFAALHILDSDPGLTNSLNQFLGFSLDQLPDVQAALFKAKRYLEEQGFFEEKLRDTIASRPVALAGNICSESVCAPSVSSNRDRKLDRFFTGKWTGIPIMLLLLAVVLWLTMTGANYPSSLLAAGFAWLEDHLRQGLTAISAPAWTISLLTDGIFHVLATVVSVMLPPMAIFFPLFTLLRISDISPESPLTLTNASKRLAPAESNA